MHMGSLGIIGQKSPENFKHILLNNGSHESVGGQPTAGFLINLVEIAKACGYKICLSAKTQDELNHCLTLIKLSQGPCFLEIKLNKISRKDLGRPITTPLENKESFMNFLAK